MIPVLRRRGQYRLSVPVFSGGINIREDRGQNQLKGAMNLFFKDGVLKTRPAVLEVGEGEDSFEELEKNTSVKLITVNNREYALKTTVYSRQKLMECQSEIECIVLRLINKNEEILLGRIELSHPYTYKLNALTVSHNGDIYVYVNYYSLPSDCEENGVYIIKKNADGTYNTPEAIAEVYAPLVLVNCVSTYGMAGDEKSLVIRGGEQVEGFNLLSDLYRIRYSAFDYSENGIRVNPSNVNEFGEHVDPLAWYSFMEYSLPFTTKEAYGTVKAEYLDINGETHTHSLYVNGRTAVETQIGTDGFYMHAFYKGGILRITFNSDSDLDRTDPAAIYMKDHVHNNLTFTAPMAKRGTGGKVTKMTQAEWYSNTSLGLNGGSRLFLGGNIDEKALVVWSDFENPLYFSENNYAYIGDRDQRVTALNKQGASLIIFKEREIYSTQYVQGEVTGEDVMNQAVSDITVRLATFPTVLINSSVGCPYPESIQLCLNRLVFLSNRNTVCVLMGQNQFSERNVFVLSENIAPMLLSEQIEKCASLDYDGSYMLFIKNRVYVMNYNSYGYVNISSFNRDGEANSHIPWFYWELFRDVEAVLLTENVPMLFFENAGWGVFTESGGGDILKEKSVPIRVRLESGEYELAHSFKEKLITGISMVISNPQGKDIKVSFSENDTQYVTAYGKERYLVLNLLPKVRALRTVKVALEFSGEFILKSLEIRFLNGGYLK
jgi:hypothetical protein